VGGGQVGAERLFDDDAGRGGEAPVPSMVTVGSKAAGGMARWKSRPGEPPIARSACSMAAASGAASAGSALANESVCWNALPGRSGGLADPEFGDRLAGKAAELFVGQVPAG
jgi:hypothetical protein